jgi:predicted  nucleic acid-binding Zn-ribbon protein
MMNELNNHKLHLGDLRVELRKVEDNVDQATTKSEEDLNRQRKELNTALDQWVQIERDTEEAMNRQDVNIANKKDDLRVNNNIELAKIKDKINVLLNKKDGTIKELRRQLSELQSKCTQIQDSIDQRRNI